MTTPIYSIFVIWFDEIDWIKDNLAIQLIQDSNHTHYNQYT
jgi:hypothetical protein